MRQSSLIVSKEKSEITLLAGRLSTEHGRRKMLSTNSFPTMYPGPMATVTTGLPNRPTSSPNLLTWSTTIFHRPRHTRLPSPVCTVGVWAAEYFKLVPISNHEDDFDSRNIMYLNRNQGLLSTLYPDDPKLRDM
jgi:hypothetical protein